jgi:hypothetical protein
LGGGGFGFPCFFGRRFRPGFVGPGFLGPCPIDLGIFFPLLLLIHRMNFGYIPTYVAIFFRSIFYVTIYFKYFQVIIYSKVAMQYIFFRWFYFIFPFFLFPVPFLD